MTKVRYVDFYHDEWLAGTIGLDPFDIGIYITACAMIYSRGGAVERDDLKRAVRCHGHAFKAALERLLRGGKLHERGSQITCKRCSNELQKAVKRVANAAQNGAKGGRPPRNPNGLDKPSGYNARAEPRTTNLEDSVEPSGSTGADAPAHPPEEQPKDQVKEVWDRGPRLLGHSARSLIGKCRRDFGDFAVMEALLATEAACASQPVEFFLGCLRRHTPRGNRHNTPISTLYEAANNVFLSILEREQREGNSDLDQPPDGALLAGGGAGTGAACAA